MINDCEFKDCEMSVVVGTDRISGINKRQWKTKRSQPTDIASTEIATLDRFCSQRKCVPACGHLRSVYVYVPCTRVHGNVAFLVTMRYACGNMAVMAVPVVNYFTHARMRYAHLISVLPGVIAGPRRPHDYRNPLQFIYSL